MLFYHFFSRPEHLFTSEVLIKNRASVYHVDKNGQTALHLAVNQKQPNQELIMYLIRNGGFFYVEVKEKKKNELSYSKLFYFNSRTYHFLNELRVISNLNPRHQIVNN